MKRLLLLLLLATPVWATTSTLTGTIKDANGNGVNGQLVMQLPVPAQDITTSILVDTVPVYFRLVNGAVTGGSVLYDVATLQPTNLYYQASVYDTSGKFVMGGNFVVTGATFNMGAAPPTSVTTSNISYLNPASVTNVNTWTAAQTFTGGVTISTNNLTVNSSSILNGLSTSSNIVPTAAGGTTVGTTSLPFGNIAVGPAANTTTTFTSQATSNVNFFLPNSSGTGSLAAVQYCGLTSGATQACANTVKLLPIIVFGEVTLNTATSQSITSLPFTAAADYSCTGSDLTTAAGIVSFNTYAAASVTIQESGGVNTDHLRYMCIGF